ncbi:MAG: exonuclease SbcCD subunit D [Coriobacteriia bacterium]|nr:exonuclease SbcCD subunit D [Coriobacteriia bacterium]
MRFLHTGDWHLGRTLHGRSLIQDQAWWLERFVEAVAETKPDAVVIAGDVYDRAVPPAEAVALLDDVITRIVRGLGVPVLMVAGNHDGPERVGFASRVLDEAGLHVAGVIGPEVRSCVIGHGQDAARFWLLPYADPIETRAALQQPEVRDHEAAVEASVARIRAAAASEPLQVLVTHHFVAGGLTSDSERGLTVGGTGAVGASVFDGFDYVALGHLHRRQSLADGRIHYPGSALKYAFDESAQAKAVSLVELTAGEPPRVEAVELGAARDVRRINGTFAELLASAAADARRDDYIEAVLDETMMPPDARGRLAELYPNLMRVVRRLEASDPDSDIGEPGTVHVERLSDEQVFERFYEFVTTGVIAEAQRATLHALLAQRKAGETR